MNKFALAKKLLLLVSIVLFASCDKDFNTIGSDIVGDDNFALEKTVYEVQTSKVLTGPVQTNNLSLNSLGTYFDPTFGRTTSHFVTQAELQVSNVTVYGHSAVDSVWVYVPFFSGDQTGTDANNVREYELDSIYGDGVKNDIDLATQKFKLKVYENGYFLNDYNPSNTLGIERHYSDDKSKIEANLLGADANGNSVLHGQYLNNSEDTSENEAFYFSKKEKIIYKTNGEGRFLDSNGNLLTDQDPISKRVVKERFPPGIWLNLNNEYFKKRILDADPDVFFNNNTFKDYFRGLYFQVEALSGNQGALASLDFSKGYIKIIYNMDNVANSVEPTETRLRRFLQFKLGGNCINFFDNDQAIPSPSNRIVLKGGAGSVATIDLFDLSKDEDHNQIPDELETLRRDFAENNWMINEASLTFYVDQSIDGMGKSNQEEPNRIYVYDAKNKKPVVDYSTDGSTNSSNPKLSKRGFGGIIEKDASGHGVKYKIRITDHMKNLIKKDSTNYTIGLSVTESINVSTNAYRKPAAGQQPNDIVPLGSVLSPLGTILYDANDPNNEKRLKLEIYYTKPD